MIDKLNVTFRKDRPLHCGGCGASFVPPDGPVLGLDTRHGQEPWPVVICPGCKETIACSWSGHVEAAEWVEA